MKRSACLALIAAVACSLVSFADETGRSDTEIILARMNQLKQAFAAQDVDAIMSNFSDDYVSGEGDSKAEFRQGLTMMIGLGMMPEIDLDLDDPQIQIHGDTANFFTLDANGHRDVAFILKRETPDVWRISGDMECSYEIYATAYGDGCVQHAGYHRCWDIHLPDGLTGEVPLVIDLHGHSSRPAQQRDVSGFRSLADDESFIVVWPYGLCGSWNSGSRCCPPASNDNIDDVGFLRKMVDQLTARHNIDRRRIYVTGLSNGAAMAQRLANEASDLIAATACFSLHLLVPEADDYSPVPIMMLYGTEDTDIYDPDDFITAQENFDKWKTMNRCAGVSVETWRDGESAAQTFQDCDNNTEVSLVTIQGGGHILYPGQQTDVDTTRLAWDFLKRFAK